MITLISRLIASFTKEEEAPETGERRFRVLPHGVSSEYYVLEVSHGGRWRRVTETYVSPCEHHEPIRDQPVLGYFTKAQRLAVEYKNNPKAYEDFVKWQDERYEKAMAKWRAYMNRKREYFEA